jgi:hypothetical protein|tara:strand:+ start:34 stop:276 length:243 start_codon:yes stop_codon:yes gene_type:complete
MRLKYSTLKKLEQLYKSDDFQIEARSNEFEGKHFMLRFGYWAEVDITGLMKIFRPLGFTVEMSEWEDDECGWLYSYYIKK